MNHPSEKTVLVVNDSQDQREMMQTIFRQAGYSTSIASDGREGFEFAKSRKFDLIVSDVIMPDGDGIELCRRIRSDEKLGKLPILLVSALRKDAAGVVEALDAGADDYIELPVAPLHLVARAERLIERKRMEDLLRESERHFRSVIENVSDVISIILPDGTIIYESPSLEQVLGYNPGEVIGKNVFDLVHKDDKARVADYFKNNVQISLTSEPIEYRFRNIGGAWLNVESVGKFIDDPSKGLVAVINTRDITGRRLAEKALRESEERFKAQYKGVPLPTYTWRKTGDDFVLTDFNDAADKITQGKSSLLLGRRAKQMYSDMPEMIENFNRCFNEQGVIQQEQLYKYRVTDDVKQLDISYVFVPPDIVMVHTRDITAEHKAEKALRNSEAKFRKVLESSRDVVYQFNLKTHNFDYMSPAAKELSGYSSEDYIEGGFVFSNSLVHPEDLSLLENHVKRALGGENIEDVHTTVEYRLKTKENGYRWISENRALVSDENKKPAAIIATARDITEQKTAEATMRFQKTLLQAQSEASIDGILVVNRTGEIISYNRRFLEMWELSEELIRTTARTHVLKSSFDQVVNRWAYIKIVSYLNLHPLETYQTEILLKSGNILDLYTAPVIDNDKIHYGRVWFFHDITHRRQAEDKLRQSEANLSAAQRITHLGSWEVELSDLRRVNNNRVHWSDEVYRIFGYEPGALQVSINYYFDSIHQDDRKRCRRAFLEAVTDRRDLNIEFRAILPNGGERILHGQGEVIYDDKTNQPLKFIGTVQDITERKLAEQKLREREEWMRAILDGSRDGIVIEDNSEISYINKSYLQLLGYDSSKELVGKLISNLVPPDEAVRLAEYGKRRLAGGSAPSVYEFKGKRKNGTLVELEGAVSTSVIGGKKFIMTAIRDITERREAEKAIAEANERAIRKYERLLDRVARLAETLGTARDLQTVYGALYSFAVISAPCTGFFISLYDEQRNLRLPVYARSDGNPVDVSDLPPMKMTGSPNSRAISTGSIIIEDDFQTAMANKPIFNIGLDTNPDLPQSCLVAPMSVMGRIVGAVEVQTNVRAAYAGEHATAMRMAANLAANAIENVRLIEQERERAEQLRRSQKLESVGRLAGGIAHDFNNMLTAINGYSELTLRRLSETDPLRRNIEEIKKAGLRSADLTHQLLAFSRQQVLQTRVLDLNEIIKDTIQMLERLIGENISLETNLDSKLNRIEADPGQLSQVLINLAVNARDAMPKGGSLRIETTNIQFDKEYVTQHFSIKPGAYVLLVVTDTGIGIDAETQEHIFEPFFTTKEIGKGTGLGLATVYGIVKQSGGFIGAESEKGIGTCFRVYLPRIDEEIIAETETGDTVVVPKGEETVLVVEDEDIVRALTRQILEESGYRVIEARNGVEALAICEQRNYKIDLLMTDVVMPQMGGRELAEKLALIKPDLPVLFTSGYTDDAVIRHNVIEADSNFIKKPFTFDQLAHKVRETLDSKK